MNKINKLLFLDFIKENLLGFIISTIILILIFVWIYYNVYNDNYNEEYIKKNGIPSVAIINDYKESIQTGYAEEQSIHSFVYYYFYVENKRYDCISNKRLLKCDENKWCIGYSVKCLYLKDNPKRNILFLNK